VIPFLFDTHCHLHFPAYESAGELAYARMQESRVWGLTIGTSRSTSGAALRFAEAHEGIWASVGMHPEHVHPCFHDPDEGVIEKEEFDVGAFKTLAQSSQKVIAIGETGLDAYRIPEDMDQATVLRDQESVFRAHIALARALQLPLIVHCRDALTRLAEVVSDEQKKGVWPGTIVHSFTGRWEEAEPLLALGCHIAINGIATFPPRKNTDPSTTINRTIERIPMDRLLIETDAPYLAPVPHRGKQNEPAFVLHVAEHIAKVRGITVEEVAEKTTKNARILFRV
jgi:TatD DNase family protein